MSRSRRLCRSVSAGPSPFMKRFLETQEGDDFRRSMFNLQLKPYEEWIASCGDDVLDTVRLVFGDPRAFYETFAAEWKAVRESIQ